MNRHLFTGNGDLHQHANEERAQPTTLALREVYCIAKTRALCLDRLFEPMTRIVLDTIDWKTIAPSVRTMAGCKKTQPPLVAGGQGRSSQELTRPVRALVAAARWSLQPLR